MITAPGSTSITIGGIAFTDTGGGLRPAIELMINIYWELGEHVFSLKDWQQGYRATGSTADLTYSGIICDLEKPFTVSGSVINYKFQFTPSSATAGTVTISAAGMSVKAQGGGTYTIEGANTDRPRIAMTANVVGHSPVSSVTGSGTVYIDLVPLPHVSVECN